MNDKDTVHVLRAFRDTLASIGEMYVQRGMEMLDEDFVDDTNAGELLYEASERVTAALGYLPDPVSP